MAQEVVHKLKSYKGKNRLMIAKVDLSLAYDSLEWGFLERSLLAWGFSKEFTDHFMSGVLGIRLFHEFNTALLAKLAWKIASGEQSLWCNILRTKYLVGANC